MATISKHQFKKCNRQISVFLLTMLFVFNANAQSLTVEVNKPGAAIRPTMWGIFFEDINMAADGGLYAELIKNRSFEFNQPMMGWNILGHPQTQKDFLVLNRQQSNPSNPRFLRVTLHNGPGEN